MQFEHEHHQETHHSVESYLGELFEDPFLDPDNGHFYVGYGSTVLEVSVEPYGPEETIVLVTAYCAQGVEPEEDLLLGLLELNHELPVGAFSLVGQDIFFSHAIFGQTLERRNLLGEIAAVADELVHHPEWRVAYRRVDLLTTTHDADGLSQLDLDLAARIVALAAELGAVAQG